MFVHRISALLLSRNARDAEVSLVHAIVGPLSKGWKPMDLARKNYLGTPHRSDELHLLLLEHWRIHFGGARTLQNRPGVLQEYAQEGRPDDGSVERSL